MSPSHLYSRFIAYIIKNIVLKCLKDKVKNNNKKDFWQAFAELAPQVNTFCLHTAVLPLSSR